MQIHELNNFTGTLGSGAYLAIDDGTDTGKISSQELLAATEARIDNIIAGPAPSAEEIVDARLGADGVTYPSLGDAIRDQFSDVKSDLRGSISNFVDGYSTGASGAWLKLNDGKLYYTDSPAVSDTRTIIVPIVGGFKYRVLKDSSTICYIGVFKNTALGSASSNYSLYTPAQKIDKTFTTAKDDVAIIMMLWGNAEASGASISDSVKRVYITLQTDSLVDELREKETLAVGSTIPNSTDLNSITDIGVYVSPNSTATASMTNKPLRATKAFRLCVMKLGDTNNIVQTMYEGTTEPRVYMRICTPRSSIFGEWKEVSYLRSKLTVKMERGEMSAGCVQDTLESVDRRSRSAMMVKVESGATVYFMDDYTNATALIVYAYGSDGSYIGYNDVLSSKMYVVGSQTAYIKMLLSHANTVAFDTLTLESDKPISESYNPYCKKSNQNSLRFVYKVTDGIYNAGRLILPPNYSMEGKPVPLAVYFHPSTNMNSWGAEIGIGATGNSLANELNYMRDEGFAIFDCYGWTSKYIDWLDSQGGSAESPFVCPTTLSAFVSGIKYVLERYNLEQSVYGFSYSLGGELSSWFSTKRIGDIDVRCMGMLAPQLDTLVAGHLGYRYLTRVILANEWQLEGDDLSTFINGNDPVEQYGQHYFITRSEAGMAFIRENMQHFAGINPGWLYVGGDVNMSEKCDDSLYWRQNWWIQGDDWHDIVRQPNAQRPLLCPVKVWCAVDDDTTPITVCNEFVKQANNAGCEAYLVPIEAGHGGHAAIGTSANAEKVSGTTALGISYSNIAKPFVQLVEWFRRWNPNSYPDIEIG